MDTFEFVGKIKSPTGVIKGFEEKTTSTGWKMRKTNVNVICGSNSHLCTVNGGMFSEDDTIKVFMKKRNETGKTVDVLFKDRFNPIHFSQPETWVKCYTIDKELPDIRETLDLIETNFEAGTITEDHLAILNVDSIEKVRKALDERAVKKYLHMWDFTEALNNLAAEAGNNKYKVTGHIEIQYNMETGMAYKNYVIDRVMRVADDTPTSSSVVMDVFFYDGFVEKKEWIADVKNKSFSGSAIINGKESFYYNNKKYNVKGTYFADVQIEVPSGVYGYRILDIMEGTVKENKDKVFSIKLRMTAVDGAEVVEFTEDMLSEDELLDIELGICTFEDIKVEKSKETVYGDRVRKYILEHKKGTPSPKAEETVYSKEELVYPYVKEEDDDEDIDFDDI